MLALANDTAEIAAVPGVDAVFVGPNDLSHSMGFDNDWKSAPVLGEIERALRAISAAVVLAREAGLLTDEETGRYAERALLSAYHDLASEPEDAVVQHGDQA